MCEQKTYDLEKAIENHKGRIDAGCKQTAKHHDDCNALRLEAQGEFKNLKARLQAQAQLIAEQDKNLTKLEDLIELYAQHSRKFAAVVDKINQQYGD